MLLWTTFIPIAKAVGIGWELTAENINVAKLNQKYKPVLGILTIDNYSFDVACFGYKNRIISTPLSSNYATIRRFLTERTFIALGVDRIDEIQKDTQKYRAEIELTIKKQSKLFETKYNEIKDQIKPGERGALNGLIPRVPSKIDKNIVLLNVSTLFDPEEVRASLTSNQKYKLDETLLALRHNTPFEELIEEEVILTVDNFLTRIIEASFRLSTRPGEYKLRKVKSHLISQVNDSIKSIESFILVMQIVDAKGEAITSEPGPLQEITMNNTVLCNHDRKILADLPVYAFSRHLLTTPNSYVPVQAIYTRAEGLTAGTELDDNESYEKVSEYFNVFGIRLNSAGHSHKFTTKPYFDVLLTTLDNDFILLGLYQETLKYISRGSWRVEAFYMPTCILPEID